jgi:hypothetical protein
LILPWTQRVNCHRTLKQNLQMMKHYLQRTLTLIQDQHYLLIRYLLQHRVQAQAPLLSLILNQKLMLILNQLQSLNRTWMMSLIQSLNQSHCHLDLLLYQLQHQAQDPDLLILILIQSLSQIQTLTLSSSPMLIQSQSQSPRHQRLHLDRSRSQAHSQG